MFLELSFRVWLCIPLEVSHVTPPKTNMALEKIDPLERETPIGNHHFWGSMIGFGGENHRPTTSGLERTLKRCRRQSIYRTSPAPTFLRFVLLQLASEDGGGQFLCLIEAKPMVCLSSC